MTFITKLLAFAVLFLFLGSASAFVSTVPGSIEFNEIPRQITFRVTNSENVDRELLVTPFFPVEYKFVEKPGLIKAGESKTVKIKFFPRTDLVGTEFFGTIKISLGVKTAEKNIRMLFLQQDSCPVSINSSITVENNGKKTFLVLSKLENQKQGQSKIFLKSIEGLPSSWSFKSSGLKKIGPFEKKTHWIVLEPAETFNGNLELVYGCDEFLESRTIKVTYDSDKGFLTGLASAFSIGFAKEELILNTLLIVIAAFLLIAFISRLVVKLARPKNMGLALPQEESLQEEKNFSEFKGTSSKNLEELKNRISEKR